MYSFKNLAKSGQETNNDWVTNIETRLIRGDPFLQLASPLLRNTMKMMRACDSNKLASVLKISPDKLSVLLQLLKYIETESELVVLPKGVIKEEKPFVDASHETKNNNYSTSSSASSFREKYGVIPAIKSEAVEDEKPFVNVAKLTNSSNSTPSFSFRQKFGITPVIKSEVPSNTDSLLSTENYVPIGNQRDSYSAGHFQSGIPLQISPTLDYKLSSTPKSLSGVSNEMFTHHFSTSNASASSSMNGIKDRSQYWSEPMISPSQSFAGSDLQSSTPSSFKHKLETSPTININFDVGFDISQFSDSSEESDVDLNKNSSMDYEEVPETKKNSYQTSSFKSNLIPLTSTYQPKTSSLPGFSQPNIVFQNTSRQIPKQVVVRNNRFLDQDSGWNQQQQRLGVASENYRRLLLEKQKKQQQQQQSRQSIQEWVNWNS